jgi:hypothetical protein
MPRALLLNSSLVRLTRDYFPDANVRVLEYVDGVSDEEYIGVQVLCFERAPHEKKELERLLKRGKELECVVISGWRKGNEWEPVHGWVLDEVEVKHASVGGVTDVMGRLVVLRKGKAGGRKLKPVVVSARPRRNAWEILKIACPGIKAGAPEKCPFTIGSSTEFVQSEVMRGARIIPYPKGTKLFRRYAHRVLTKYGRKIWVKRKFESKELLAAVDVPERLVHLAAGYNKVNALLDKVDWPIKTLQSVAEAVNGVLSFGDRFTKRKAEEVELKPVEAMLKRC